MLKSVLFFWLCVKTLVRAVALLILLVFGMTDLPLVVLLASSAAVVCGVVCFILRRRQKLRMWHVTLFYAVDSLLVLFALFFLAFYSVVEVNALEVMASGSLLDVLINVVFLILSLVRSRYVSIAAAPPKKKKKK